MSKRQFSTINQLLFVAFFLATFLPIGEAQIIKGRKNKYKAAEHIIALRNGTLLMLLPTKHKNISAINKALSQEGLSSKSTKRLNKKRNKIVKNQQKANETIVETMWNHYEFSNFRILYDTAMVHVLAGEGQGHFLNDQLELDPSITLDSNNPIYSVRFGQGSVSETNNFEGFIIRDSENEQPPKPFPYYVKAKYPPSSVFAAFIGKAADVSPNFKKMILQLNSRLTNYYPTAEYSLERKKLKEEMKQQKKEAKESEN